MYMYSPAAALAAHETSSGGASRLRYPAKEILHAVFKCLYGLLSLFSLFSPGLFLSALCLSAPLSFCPLCPLCRLFGIGIGIGIAVGRHKPGRCQDTGRLVGHLNEKKEDKVKDVIGGDKGGAQGKRESKRKGRSRAEQAYGTVPAGRTRVLTPFPPWYFTIRCAMVPEGLRDRSIVA